MYEAELLRRVIRFGPPFYVPAGRWRVVGVEGGGGTEVEPYRVVVFAEGGVPVVRTAAASRPPTPLSLRVYNVQVASSPRQALDDAWRNVVVDEGDAQVTIAGKNVTVRVLRSHNIFSFETPIGDRVLEVGGHLWQLEELVIERLDDVALAS